MTQDVPKRSIRNHPEAIVKKLLSLLLLAVAVASPVLAATKTTTLAVKGWTCGSCAGMTRSALKKLNGVEAVETDFAKRDLVEWSTPGHGAHHNLRACH